MARGSDHPPTPANLGDGTLDTPTDADRAIADAWESHRDARARVERVSARLMSLGGYDASLVHATGGARARFHETGEALSETCRRHSTTMHARLAAAATAFFAAHPDAPAIRWKQTITDADQVVVSVLAPDVDDPARPDAVAVFDVIPHEWMWNSWSTSRGEFIGELTAAGIRLPYTRFR